MVSQVQQEDCGKRHTTDSIRLYGLNQNILSQNIVSVAPLVKGP